MVGVPHLTGKQKIYTALVILVCEPGEVEQRLQAAYKMALASIDPQLDLPPDTVAEFSKIRDELRKEYLLPPIPRREPDRKRWAANMATRLVAFYDGLARTR